MIKFLGIVGLYLLWFNTVFALPKCTGEDPSKWTMCEGAQRYKSLDFQKITYVGEFQNGKKMVKELKYILIKIIFLMEQNM